MISLLDTPNRFNNTTPKLSLSITQLVRLAKRAFVARGPGTPRFCYLPGEIFGLFEMVAQAEMEEMVPALLAPFLETAKIVAYDGMEIREHDGLEIIVTEHPL
jgi:hypothetical protein